MTIKHFGNYLGAAFLMAGMAMGLGAETTGSGYVDFGKLSAPASGGEFVEVNISSNLIAMVGRLAKDSQPEISDLVQGLEHIRVSVIGLDDGNRADLQQRVKSVREELDHQGWERVVTVQQSQEDVMVQIKTRGGEAVQGLVVTVLDSDKEAVLVNIVGDIKPERLGASIQAIGLRFNIEPLKNLAPVPKK